MVEEPTSAFFYDSSKVRLTWNEGGVGLSGDKSVGHTGLSTEAREGQAP